MAKYTDWFLMVGGVLNNLINEYQKNGMSKEEAIERIVKMSPYNPSDKPSDVAKKFGELYKKFLSELIW